MGLYHRQCMHGLTDISRSASRDGQLRARDVASLGHSKPCKPPVVSSLWARESEVNNVCWKCPHQFNSDPRPVDCKRSRSYFHCFWKYCRGGINACGNLSFTLLVEVITELRTYVKNKKKGMYTSREPEICQALSKIKNSGQKLLTSLDVIFRQIHWWNSDCCIALERALFEDHLRAFILIGTPPHANYSALI